MASYNRIILMGHLVRDPQLDRTQAGTAVSEIDLAVNDRVKRGEKWIEETTFVQVAFFGRTAEVVAQYLKKGSPLLVEGRLKYETWHSGGERRSKHKVVADKMQMLGTRSQAPQSSQQTSEGTSAEQTRP